MPNSVKIRMGINLDYLNLEGRGFMKRTKIQAEGIGATINRFENAEEQNVRTFNEMFKGCPLTGFNPEHSVVIGDYNFGSRDVTINDTIVLPHEFSHIDYSSCDIVVQRFLLFQRDGKLVGKYNSITAASEEMGISHHILKAHIMKGKYTMMELNHES